MDAETSQYAAPTGAEIRVTAKEKLLRSWSETDAQRIAEPINVTIAQNGDGYEVRPQRL